MSNEIGSAIIQAVGTIIASIIGVGYLEKIIHKEIVPGFFSYSEPNHDLWEILRSATTEVVFVVAYGDQMLQKHKKHLETLLRKGVMIKFLMLDPENAVRMGVEYMYALQRPILSNKEDVERYINKEDIETYINIIDGYRSSLKALKELHEGSNGEYLEVRQTKLPLSASYVAVDLPDVCYDDSQNTPHRRPIIQMMVYQFSVVSEHSPITYLTPQKSPEQFANTGRSIQEMWSLSESVNFKECEKELLRAAVNYIKTFPRSSRKSASSPHHTAGSRP